MVRTHTTVFLIMYKYIEIKCNEVKNPKPLDFIRFQGGTPVFLTMYRKVKIKNK